MMLLDAPASSLSLSQTSLDIQFGDRNPAVLCTDFADCWLRNEYSVPLIIARLEHMVTQWNALLFHLFYGLTIYRPVCLFLYIKLRWNYNTPMQFANEASQFQFKFWEKHDITVRPVITYIYLCVQCYAVSLLYFFKPSNWNIRQAWKNLYTLIILSYTDIWCLVPFSSNISCNRTHKVCLCFEHRRRNSVIYQSLNDIVLCSGVHSKKILLHSTPS